MTRNLPPAPRVRAVNGTPTLMAGDAPLPAPVFCLFYDQALRDDVVTSLYGHGIGAFAVRNMIGVGNGSQTDQTIELAVTRLVNVAKAAPEARLMADCLFFPSEEWMLQHPHEGFITADRDILVLGKNGESDRRDYIRVPGPSIQDVEGGTVNGEDAEILYGRRRVSPFSLAFAREAARSARKLLNALRQEAIADRLWGVFLGCYICGEWNLNMSWPDHSRVAMAGFRGRLRAAYGTDRALRAAWADPLVTLRSAWPPREHAQMDISPMIPATQRHADYRAAEAAAMAEQFGIMARGVKRADARLAVGGFFPGASPPQSDWLRLVQDPAVDFLATPLAYENRGPGNGVSSQSPFCDGFSALGKVWFDELDTRTLIAGPPNERYGRADSVARSVDLLWRDAGQMLIRGHHGWWLDFGNNGVPPYSWHLEPEFLRFHRRFAELWRELPRLDRRPLGEIKVFIPSDAARHFQILYPADTQRHTEWTLLGAPVEFDVLENLLDGRSQLGKLNVIHGAVCLSGDALRRLKKRLHASRSLVVWLGGVGLFEDGRPVDEYRAEGLVPIRQCFSHLEKPAELEARPTPEAVSGLGIPRKVLVGQPDRLFTSGFTYSSAKLNVPMKRIEMGWKLEVTDPDAVPLARLAPDGSVAVAMKRDASGTTHVVYNLPVLNTVFLRALARKAGCHLFTERDDVVYASKGLVLLHAAYSGVHRLCFPRDVRVLDLRKDKSVELRDCQLSVRLKRGQTRLYRCETNGKKRSDPGPKDV